MTGGSNALRSTNRCPPEREVQLTGELSAILGAAYESFLKARLQRRHGRRGNVHARALVNFVEMVNEMTEGAAEARGAVAVWRTAITELDRDRGEIEADVLAHHGHVVVEHEWAAFLSWLHDLLPRRT